MLYGELGRFPISVLIKSEAEEIFKKSNKMETFPYFFRVLARLPRSPK